MGDKECVRRQIRQSYRKCWIRKEDFEGSRNKRIKHI